MPNMQIEFTDMVLRCSRELKTMVVKSAAGHFTIHAINDVEAHFHPSVIAELPPEPTDLSEIEPRPLDEDGIPMVPGADSGKGGKGKGNYGRMSSMALDHNAPSASADQQAALNANTVLKRTRSAPLFVLKLRVSAAPDVVLNARSIAAATAEVDAWVAENPGKPMKECPTSIPSEELGHAVECATPATAFAERVVGLFNNVRDITGGSAAAARYLQNLLVLLTTSSTINILVLTN